MSRQENDKTTIYPLVVGVLEYNYLEKLFKECYGGKFKLGEKLPNIPQIGNKIKSKTKYLYNNMQAIKNRLEISDKTISKSNSILILITDQDNGDLLLIQQLKDKFLEAFGDFEYHFFILNVKQLEYWLRHYYDHSFEDCKCEKKMKTIKSEMSRDISDKQRWSAIFSGKHKNAKNKYEKEIGVTYEKESCFSIAEGISDYTKIKDEYSDFPCFFRSIKKWFDIEM